ncbi:hypothetical protein X975_08946, partial [Stegodyphus mimosarum]
MSTSMQALGHPSSIYQLALRVHEISDVQLVMAELGHQWFHLLDP